MGSVVQVHPDPGNEERRGHSSAGRASALQAGGRRFDPDWLQELRREEREGEESKGKEIRRQKAALSVRKKERSVLYSDEYKKIFNNMVEREAKYTGCPQV